MFGHLAALCGCDSTVVRLPACHTPALLLAATWMALLHYCGALVHCWHVQRCDLHPDHEQAYKRIHGLCGLFLVWLLLAAVREWDVVRRVTIHCCQTSMTCNPDLANDMTGQRLAPVCCAAKPAKPILKVFLLVLGRMVLLKILDSISGCTLDSTPWALEACSSEHVCVQGKVARSCLLAQHYPPDGVCEALTSFAFDIHGFQRMHVFWDAD